MAHFIEVTVVTATDHRVAAALNVDHIVRVSPAPADMARIWLGDTSYVVVAESYDDVTVWIRGDRAEVLHNNGFTDASGVQS